MTDLRQKDYAAMRSDCDDAVVQELIELVQAAGCPICKKQGLIVDMSMTLIQCDSCGIAFEYRYDRGVIPFHTIIESGA